MNCFFKSLFLNKITAKFFHKIILRIHTFTYKLSGIFASILNDGIHPKHKIMKYKEWFVENIENNWVVMDVGCNTGLMPEIMSEKAVFVYGIEMEKKHVLEAKKNRNKENIEYIWADATNYDYSKIRLVSVVTLSNVLEHIECRVTFLQKLIKQIPWKDKKRFLIRVPMVDREWISVYKKGLGLEYRLDRTHFTEYTFKEFKKELSDSFIEIKSFHIQFGEIYAVCEAK